MAEKTETEKPEDKAPDFSDVEFEGEQPGAAEGGTVEGEGDERLGEREGVSVEGERAGETADQKHARRRAERQAKKERIKAEREENRELKAEVRRLASKVDELGGTVDTRLTGVEKRVASGDVTAIDNRLDVLRRIHANAKVKRSEAMTAGNGTEFDQADQIIRDSEIEYSKLTDRRAALIAAGPTGERKAETRQEEKQDRPDPKVARLANAFIASFPEYDPEGSDADSLIVQALDSAVLADGFDPRTQEYWDELADRVRDRIPEWDEESKPNGTRRQANGRPRARATVQGSGRDGGGEGGGAKYVISAARVQAMKDAGKWDDLAKRDKQIKEYKKWDRENPQQRNG